MAAAPVKRVASANRNSNATGVTSYSFGVTAAPGIGNKLILHSALNVDIATLTDSKGNTWTKAKSLLSGSLVVTHQWWTDQDGGNLTTSDTITIGTATNLFGLAVSVIEWSGLQTGAPDQTASAATSVASTTRSAGTTPTTTNANEAVIATFGINLNETSFTAGTGYTAEASPAYINNGNNTRAVESEYQVVSSTGTFSPSATGGASATGTGVVATYLTVTGSPPVNTVAPTVTGTAASGSILSCSQGTWSNSPTSYSYQWRANGVNLGGATSSTFTTSDTYLGAVIDCVVTATNASGSASQPTSNSITVTAVGKTYGTAVYGSSVYGATPGSGGGSGDTSFFRHVNGSILPDIEITFDWQNDPSSTTFNWEDITPYVVSYSRSPVRTNEFDQPGPATATLVLRNDDGRFIPANVSGPYYGGLKKYRRFRVRAQWNNNIYPRFYGYVTDWPQTWDQAGMDQYVTIQLVDNLFPLLTCDLVGQSFASEASGAAIGDVLVASGVVAWVGGTNQVISAGNLDQGVSTIAAVGPLGTSSYALQRIQDISASENGVTFADGAGLVQFHDRHHRLVTALSSNIQATIGDSPGQIPYLNPEPQYGDVWTIVNVTPLGGSVQTATNAAGVSSFWQQTLNFPPSGTYQVSSAAEAQNAANYLASRYSNPIERITSVELVGANDPTQWDSILSLDTSDRVVFQRKYLSNGQVAGTFSVNQFVEGYGDDVKVGQDWRVTVALSPADQQAYWLLGDATYGLLGKTTQLGY